MMPHTLSEYIELIKLFANRALSASEFEQRYLRMFKEDSTIRPEVEYEVLNGLFSDVDAFSAESELRSKDGLNEEQLRSAAESALATLRAQPGSALS